MRVLVTGGSGMLGRHVVRAAEAAGHDVAYPDREAWDITDAEQGDYWMRTVVPDVLINCAGLIPSRHADDVRMIEVNGIAPNRLAALCIEHEAVMVQVSTDCVFDAEEQQVRGWSRLDAPHPTDPYGISKLIGELSASVMGKIFVVRTSFIGPDHGLWRWYVDNDAMQVEAWANARWSGTTVDVVAESLIKLVEHPVPPQYSVIHMATAIPTDKAAVLERLHELYPFAPVPVPVDEPRLNRWLVADHIIPGPTDEQLARLAQEWGEPVV